MKNYRTPRTLAETEFTTGYCQRNDDDGPPWAGLLGWATLIVVMIAIGVLLAWRG